MNDVTCPEEWRPVAGYEGHYEVSNLGRVRSLKTYRPQYFHLVLRDKVNARSGYREVGLLLDGHRSHRTVHSLVAEAWLGARPDGLEIRHLDGDRLNARVDNLVYGTQLENMADRARHGNHNESRKTHCPVGHPYDEPNTRVDRRGKRACRACDRARRRSKHDRSRNQPESLGDKP